MYSIHIMARKSKTEAPLFGQCLAACRKTRGLTQEELAARLGVSVSLINYYERRTKNPTADVLVKLSEILNVSTDELLGKKLTVSKPGPIPKIERQLNELQKLPAKKQKLVSELIDTVIQKEDSQLIKSDYGN